MLNNEQIKAFDVGAAEMVFSLIKVFITSVCTERYWMYSKDIYSGLWRENTQVTYYSQ